MFAKDAIFSFQDFFSGPATIASETGKTYIECMWGSGSDRTEECFRQKSNKRKKTRIGKYEAYEILCVGQRRQDSSLVRAQKPKRNVR